MDLRNRSIIQRSKLIKFFKLIFSIGYGFFIASYLNNHFILDSGDITSLVRNADEIIDFNRILVWRGSLWNILLNGDSLFQISVLILKNMFSQDSLTILGVYAFLISTATFYIFSINLEQRKYLFLTLILFVMVFFTPRVINLFASGVRSGIAFTILIIAFMYLKGAKQYVLFAISSLIHLSMLPLIAFYFLFNLIQRNRIRLSFPLSMLLVIILTSLLAAVVPRLSITYSPHFNQSLLYMSMVAYVGLLILFLNKRVIQNVYGFISISLILIIMFGYIIQFSFIRYVGNAILLYLLFLIKEGSPRNIQIFLAGYTPFFLITLYYSIANYW